jgi:hypothetical protein
LQKLAAANTANEEIRKRFEAAQVQQQQAITQLKQAQSSVQTRLNNLLQDEGKIAEKVAEKRKTSLEVATENQQEYINLFLSGLEKELEELDLKQEAEKEKLIKFGKTQLEIEERFLKERQDLIDSYSKEEVEKQQSIFDAILEASLGFAIKQKAIDEQTIATQRAVQDTRLQIAQDFSNGLTAILSLAGAESAENAGFAKALALFQIGIDTAVAIVSAIRNSQSPTPDNVATGGLAGIAKGAAITASILAAVAQAKQVLQAQPQPPPPQFEDGGEISINGKSHSQGGEIVTVGGRAVAEVEGGEGLYVMKKNAYQKIKQFSAINEAFGGKSWLNGSSKYLADGGAIPAPVLSIKEFEKKQAIKDKSVRISEL